MIALLVVPPPPPEYRVVLYIFPTAFYPGRVKYFDRKKKKKKSLSTLAGFNGSRNQWKRGIKVPSNIDGGDGDKFNSRFIELIDFAISSCLIIPV